MDIHFLVDTTLDFVIEIGPRSTKIKALHRFFNAILSILMPNFIALQIFTLQW